MHTQTLNTHCLPYALLAISTSGTSSTSVCARARARALTQRDPISITRTRDDQQLRSLRKIFERKIAARRTAGQRDGAFEVLGVSTNF